jgi:hypothetical protein
MPDGINLQGKKVYLAQSFRGFTASWHGKSGGAAHIMADGEQGKGSIGRGQGKK